MELSPRFFLSIILLAVLLSFSSLVDAAADKPLVVAATIFPAADITRHVAGPAVRVIQVLPAGASPHTFDLTPGKVRELQPARLIFKIGGIDDWVDGIAESLPRATIVSLHRNIVRLPFHDDGHGHDHGSRQRDERFDPHYWLNAANGAIMARTIADALSASDPAHAVVYEKNCREYTRELTALHAEIGKMLSSLKSRKMLVFHDGWRYFAAAYGLEIAAVFQASPGREPSPRDIQELYAQVKRHGLRAVFSEPQLPAASIEPLLRDLGLTLFVIDPLGGMEPRDSYVNLLQRNARVILQALGH